MEQESQEGSASAATAMSLPVGTRLGEFELLNVIGEGGFSIVYLALDHSLQRTVAIKEYLPGAIALRDAEGIVRPRFEKYETTFKTGLQSFLNEARILAQFEHPALIRIHRFWEQNGTAYMVMQYCKGKTLRQVLLDEPLRRQDEPWLKHQVMVPVLDALRLLHAKNYYHRDLSPDNIMVLDTGAPMLLDFGAARQVIGDMTQALTVILKPGFAPIEQYADDESMRQGPWTDIYGAGAVLYFAVTGKAPVASVARLVKDPLKKLQQASGYGISAAFARAIDHSLAVFPNDRPQSVDEFQVELSRVVEVPGLAEVEGPTLDTPPEQAPPLAPNEAMVAAVEPLAPKGAPAEAAVPADPVPLDLSEILNTNRSANEQVPAEQTNAPSAPPLAPLVKEAPKKVGAQEPRALGSSGGRRRWVGVAVGAAAVMVLGVSVAWWTTKDSPVSAQPTVTDTPQLANQAPVSPVARAETTASPEPSTAAPGPESKNQDTPVAPSSGVAPLVVAAADRPTVNSVVVPGDTAPTPIKPTEAEKPAVAKPPEQVTATATSNASVVPPPSAPPAKITEPTKSKDAVAELLAGRGGAEKVPSTSSTNAAAGSPAQTPAVEVKPSKPGAYLRLSVQPWGRVLIDGQDKGTSPPVMRVWLPEGEHRVVIENGELQKYTGSIKISDKKDVTLAHKFGQ